MSLRRVFRFPRLPRHVVLPHAQRVSETLYEKFETVEVCGSLRRGLETVGDIDVVVAGPKGSVDVLTVLSSCLTHVREEVGGKEGPRRCYLFDVEGCRVPCRVDVWTVPVESFGSAVLHVTGPGPFNVIMRRWARYRGMELRLTGVLDKAGAVLASRTEEDCFTRLGWDFIPAVQRSDYRPHVQRYLDEMEGALGSHR